jgi:tRNA nucleotidyltransferase (CCA-adding enzyme)
MGRKPKRKVEIYRVGGAVRDELLGRASADRDWVVVGATPEMLVASGYTPVGRDFPVFLHPQTHEEHALARTERKHGRGYRGFEFFASPDVTLEQDLARRDLTINAMARAADGRLIDPFHGAADLERGVLRHVSPAFAEDPLRVLRVARFAARFGFVVAPATQRLMRAIVASGELETLAPERVWQELARGLQEPAPFRMIEVLDRCGALASLLPEVAPRMRDPQARRHLRATLAYAAAHAFALDRRYALLAADLAAAASAGVTPGLTAAQRRNRRAAAALSTRLKAPVECRDLAVLAAAQGGTIARADTLTPAGWLALFTAADALRRPERLVALLDVCAAVQAARSRGRGAFPQAALVRGALATVKVVDAGAIARNVGGGAETSKGRSERIALAVRKGRLAALRAWQRTLR